jgi:bifunctional ADP-heptose synthase (sugar kinase/adenylyltransferase)
MSKIFKNLQELKKEMENLKKFSRKIVWTNGCFDLIHP